MKNDCTLSFSLLFHSKDSQVNSIRFESQQYLLELFFLTVWNMASGKSLAKQVPLLAGDLSK